MNSNQDPASPTLRPETDSDRLLAEWLASEAPDREPPILLPAVLARTALTRRRPAWHIPDWWLRRTSPRTTAGRRSDRTMFSTLKLISAGAIVALVGAYALAGVLVTPVPPAPAAPASHVVAQDGTGDFATISEAVAAAAEGDTILVRPGTYSESIVIDKSITLMGDGEREEIVITTPPVGEGAITDEGRSLDLPTTYALLLDHSDAAVSGLTLQGDKAGILVKGGSPTLTGLRFDHVGTPFSGYMSDRGMPISLLEEAAPTITDNFFSVTNSIFVGEDSSPQIGGNVLEGGTHILVVSAGPGTVIRGNTISGSSKWAITISASSVLVEGNTIIDSGDGLWFDAEVSDGGPVDGPDTDVIVRGNTISGSGGNGITIDDGSRAVVEGNTIAGAASTGIAITDAVPTVTGNQVSGSQVGLSVSGDQLPALEGNTFCGNEDNVKLVQRNVEQPDPELPGNEVCPDGPVTAAGG